jgi:voltage-dependent potassium channel beta subunit
MLYRHLGKTGLEVSVLSFGSWVSFANQLDEDGALACLQRAFDGGINFFDNAEVYADGESETLMGKAFKRLGFARKDLVLSTKVFWGGKGRNDRGLSKKHVKEGVEAALQRLQIDYVDLVFCHRPDPRTPLEETVRAMNQLITEGKALYWGTSEWSAADIAVAWGLAARDGLEGPVMEQPQYNLLHRERVEREYARLYETIGLGTTIWSPLASGLLTGKYNDGIPAGSRLSLERFGWLKKRVLGDDAKDKIARVKKLGVVADELGCTLAQLAIAWCIRHPRVSTAILGASKVAQVDENLKALEVLPRLTPEVLEAIEGIVDNAPAVDQDFREL